MRLSAFVLLSATALLSPAVVASASPVYLSSSTTSTAYNGYSTAAPPSTGSAAGVYDIGNGDGVWSAPLYGSTYISFAPGTNPAGAYANPGSHAPNGYYTYTTTFQVTDLKDVYGSVTVLADDTVAVYLNSASNQILAEAPGPYPLCATAQPNCTTPTTAGLSGFQLGTNTLTFVVHQANDFATGLDYSGFVATPEPNSLALLGTGLCSGAGLLLRRFRRA